MLANKRNPGDMNEALPYGRQDVVRDDERRTAGRRRIPRRMI